MRATLEDWIPKILGGAASGRLSADGVHAARRARPTARPTPPAAAARGLERWSAAHRGNHEGYVAGYFIESAINHYMMTGGKDARLYNAAKKLADCWADHIGPAPKQEWFDGHQEMEQALVRFGRFVNEVEPSESPRLGTTGPGDRYIALAKFLLDCRKNGSEYDQSHLPVVAAVRSRRPRRARGVHVLGHGRRRRRNARRGLPERRQVALGQHRPPQVLPDGRRRQRRERPRASARTTRCGTTPTARRARAAARSSSSGSCTSPITTRSTPTSTSRRCTTRSVGSLDLDGRNFYYDNPLDAARRRGTRGTACRAASATSRARC